MSLQFLGVLFSLLLKHKRLSGNLLEPVGGRIIMIYGEKRVKEYIKGIGPEFKELSYDLSSMEFNCSEKKFRLLTFSYYNQNGSLISSFTSDSSSWNFIFPDSILEALFNIVCDRY